MSDTLITVGTYGNAAEAEIAHAALTEEDIPAFLEGELAATVLPGTAVKLQVPEDRARKAVHVLENVDRHRKRRLPPTPELPGDRLAKHALLLACFALFLFPVLVLSRIPAVLMFGDKWSDLLKVQDSAPMLLLPVLLSLVSASLLSFLWWKRPEMTEESRREVRDAWCYILIVLGTAVAGFGLLWMVGHF